MFSEERVLECLRDALADALPRDVLADLTVLRRGPHRRRSSLYFVGTVHPAPRYRWVVKQPKVHSRQEDLASPVPALGQYEALQRLYRHLHDTTDGRQLAPSYAPAREPAWTSTTVTTPRPVAYLPEVDAYAMEYVPGPTVTALMRPAAVIRPGRLAPALEASAEALHAVHSLQPSEPDLVDLEELGARVQAQGRRLLEAAGLPVRDSWFTPDPSLVGVCTEPRVLLHGDFTPENIVLSPSGTCCLEPDLSRVDWPEHDVVRFVLMLLDAPLFVAGADFGSVHQLGRESAATFLRAFYRGRPPSDLLRPLLLMSLAARWSTRHTDLARRSPRLRRVREGLVRRHFRTLLDEVSSPQWSWLGRELTPRSSRR